LKNGLSSSTPESIDCRDAVDEDEKDDELEKLLRTLDGRSLLNEGEANANACRVCQLDASESLLDFVETSELMSLTVSSFKCLFLRGLQLSGMLLREVVEDVLEWETITETGTALLTADCLRIGGS
jgi:hypothetical protein